MIVCLVAVLSSCHSSDMKAKYDSGQTVMHTDRKQRGVHLFGRTDTVTVSMLADRNIEWATLVSWASQDDVDSPVVYHHNGDSSLIAETDSRWVSRIQKLRVGGIKVFVKPHVWIDHPSGGKWRSDISPAAAEDWATWAASYRDYILRYARLAEQGGAEMYSVGAELTSLTKDRPRYWSKLIAEVREVYTGKLVYSANWYEEYEHITFWDELDYVGVQAYFPLCDKREPTLAHLRDGWADHLSGLQGVSRRVGKPIIFTELGYKSTALSAKEPWLWEEDPRTDDKECSLQTQERCYQAFFQEVWPQGWFAGVHFWQYRTDHDANDHYYDLDFTPQGKPAEGVLIEAFGK